MSEGFAKKVANTQVWKAIFRHGPPNNARNRAAVVAGNVLQNVAQYAVVCPRRIRSRRAEPDRLPAKFSAIARSFRQKVCSSLLVAASFTPR